MVKRKQKINLKVDIGGIKFPNPVIAASGTFGYGEEFEELIDLNRLGGIVTKGISFKPKSGNPPPRVCETPAGMLNSIGLENVGVESFVKDKLPFLRKLKPRILVNIFGYSVKEYVKVAASLTTAGGIDGLEINISCPNIKKGGIEFGRNGKLTFKLIDSIRKATDLPIIPKLTPNVTDIREIARASEDAGADAISLINTLTGMSIDINTRTPKLGAVSGGLSGPAIKPVALHMLFSVYKEVSIPLIGMGGIRNYRDAIEFFLAGASALSIGTANFINPHTAEEVIKGLEGYLIENKIKRIKELTGGMKTPDNDVS